MTASLATRCTSCETVFRVGRPQLDASDGWVRCGRCGTVFNARESLFEFEEAGEPGAAPEPPATPADTGIAPTQPMPMAPTIPGELSTQPAAWAPDTPAPAAAGPAPSPAPAQATFQPDRTVPLGPIDQMGWQAPTIPGGTPWRAAAVEPTWDEPPTPQRPEPGLASEAPATPLAAAAPPPGVPASPAPPLSAIGLVQGSATPPSGATWTAPPSPPAAPTVIAAELPSELPAWPPTMMDAQLALPVDGEAEPLPSVPTLAAASQGVEIADPLPIAAPPIEVAAQPSFVREAEQQASWKRSTSRVGLAVVCALLALLLAWQGLVNFRNELAARHPGLKPLLQAACAPIRCQLEPLRDIAALSVESSSLMRATDLVPAPPPDAASAAGAEASAQAASAAGVPAAALPTPYRLNLTVRNRGAVELALPSLDVTLTDPEGRVVSRRVLKLAQLGARADTLAAGQELALAGVLDLGMHRVEGYTVELFYE